jgi:hypothetical protein
MKMSKVAYIHNKNVYGSLYKTEKYGKLYIT